MKNYLTFVACADSATIDLIDNMLIEMALGLDDKASLNTLNSIFDYRKATMDIEVIVERCIAALELLRESLLR